MCQGVSGERNGEAPGKPAGEEPYQGKSLKTIARPGRISCAAGGPALVHVQTPSSLARVRGLAGAPINDIFEQSNGRWAEPVRWH